MGIVQARILEWVAIPSSRGSSQPRDQTQVSHIAGMNHQGNPRILEWIALSLLQGIFPTQGSNQGLLHSRQIFYHLSHQHSFLGKPLEGLVNSVVSGIYSVAFRLGRHSSKAISFLRKPWPQLPHL